MSSINFYTICILISLKVIGAFATLGSSEQVEVGDMPNSIMKMWIFIFFKNKRDACLIFMSK